MVAVEPLTLRTEVTGVQNAPKLDTSGPVIVLGQEFKSEVEIQAEPVEAAPLERSEPAAILEPTQVAPFETSSQSRVFLDKSEADSAPAVQTQAPKAVIVETKTGPADSSELSEILEKERGLAHQFFKRLEIVDTYVARLKVSVPAVAEKVRARVEEKVVEVHEKVIEVQEAVAAKIKKLESPISDVDRLPLSDLTANTGLMKKAKLSFDEQSTTWSAVWKKPALFHFGMILHPELMDQVQEGEKLHFESKGMQLALVRTGDDKLLVEQTNGARHELSAKRLEGLLQRSIKVDGLELSLDGGGNLVLKAEGEKARTLANKFSLL